MSPSLPEVLVGVVQALSEPPPPESAGEFMAGRLGALALLCLLSSQEAERGPVVAAWENGAIADLCERAAPLYDAELDGALTRAGAITAGDGSLSSLTVANAELRRTLDALHQVVEAAEDERFDREILSLYREMAARRRLDLPTVAG